MAGNALALRAEMAELTRLSAWVDDRVSALALGAAQAYALRLCVEELAGNVMLHAGAGALRVTVDGPPLRLLVEDDGPEFDPSTVAEPARPSSLDDAVPGGLGLLLTRRYSSSLAYARAGGWNRVSVAL